MPIAPGQTILNKYHILKLLGEGGSGRVWLAQEITFSNRQVAIKEPRTDLPAADLAELQRYYQQELKVCALLEQASAPNLVRTFTVEPYDDGLLLVMTYMPGGDLANMLHQQSGSMPVDRAVKITHDILAPLQVAHNHPQGIVHRDIKPQNILFDAAGKAYLGDWGLAQLSGVSGRSQLSAHAHPGSPLYMAPEQARSTDYLTPAADIYAVGCVLFEMLTDKRYKRVRPGTTAGSLRSDIPAWLDQVIGKALAEDPFDRYEDAAAMATALAEALPPVQPAVSPVTARPATPSSTVVPARSTSGRWIAIGGVLIALLISGLLYWRGINPNQMSGGDQTATSTVLVTAVAQAPITTTLTATPTVTQMAVGVATATVAPAVALLPTDTATETPIPTDTTTPTPQPTSTPTPDLTATRTAASAGTAAAVTATLSAQPTVTPGDMSSPTATPNPPQTDIASVAIGLTRTPTNTAAPTLRPTNTFSPTNTPAVTSESIIQFPKRIGFVSYQNREPIIYTMDTRSRQITKIVQGIDPAWSTDGQKLVYGSTLGVISIADADGSNARILTSQMDWQPVWSPDGNQIVFISERTGKRHIYKMDKNGQNQVQLTNHALEDRHPAWSPDGTAIAFISNRSGKWQIWVMTAEGADQVQFTDGKYDYYKPTWSPTGQQLAFGTWTGSRNEIWIENIVGNDTKVLVTDSVYKLESEGYGLSWSRSGWIGYVSDRDGRPQIYAIRVDGTNITRITNGNSFDYFPVWLAN